MNVSIHIKRLHPAAKMPRTWSEHAVGLDLHAILLTPEGRPNTAIIAPHHVRSISTGLAVEPPPGFCLSIWSRSGLAARSVFVANAPGLIDPDFRGEIKVLLFNGGMESFYLKHEDRIAQLVAVPYIGVTVDETAELSETTRGESGLGSTGR